MSLYGLTIGITIVICLSYFSRRNHLIPKSGENLFGLGLIIFALIGARTYHVIDYWSFYSQNLWQILNIRAGGLGIYGALIFGLIYVFVTSKIYKFEIIKLLNLVAPIVPLAQAVGRLGNFFNHEIPLWWLESILNLLLFFLLRFFPRNSFAKYLLGYGLIRFFFEFLRSDTWTIGSIKIAQIISIIFIIIGALLCLNKRKVPPSSRP